MFVPGTVSTLPRLELSQKNQNNSKKIKNIILASFNAKPGQDRLKMR